MIILIAGLAAVARPVIHRRHTYTHTVHAATRRPEHLHVSAINLTDADETVLTLKDATGKQLAPARIPLTICHKDHLGRLLPGNDVDLVIDETRAADGTLTRSVAPTRFTQYCS